ncbi:response regulator transcription factor [Thermostaphylospora chromogena]|uniref:Two-component system, OmpR family, response regulator MprA n=1 Tax=Thermostaphylospora chromogena TaxID=35622 RepID=A0A1H1A8Y2_9ACTN|nr:response regulator transcription factor [Thermostaphylospora chromogena]SDQ36040.1 two-component system, OmpR family, response regulator MprA [Thermostaphylospora chromogena]
MRENIAESAAGARLLVVDDEPELRDALSRALRLAGYRVAVAADGRSGLGAVATDRPDLVVLDVRMPDMGGIEVCRTLRKNGDGTPVLMLTALDGVRDRVAGLDAGADDYLVKPFALEELFARVRALLRRTPPGEGAPPSYADLTLLPHSRQGRRGERVFDLTRTEYALLDLLLRNAGQVLPREVILDRIWGYASAPGSNTLEVYIRYLRRKTEAGGEPRLIQTVHGLGYSLRKPA